MNKKFFTELSRVLAEQGIETAPMEGNRLPVLLGGQPAFRVQSNGTLCITPKDIGSPEATELYHKVAPFSAMVYEYTSLMERAPLLESDSGNDSYRLLADFNGVVLAGKETESYGYQFVTWWHDDDGAGYLQGGYFSDDYQAAKEDFVRKTELILPSRLFNDEELTELYRCIHDTLDGNYDLTERQLVLLERLSEQIESAIPDLQEQIEQAKRDVTEGKVQTFNMWE